MKAKRAVVIATTGIVLGACAGQPYPTYVPPSAAPEAADSVRLLRSEARYCADVASWNRNVAARRRGNIEATYFSATALLAAGVAVFTAGQLAPKTTDAPVATGVSDREHGKTETIVGASLATAGVVALLTAAFILPGGADLEKDANAAEATARKLVRAEPDAPPSCVASDRSAK